MPADALTIKPYFGGLYGPFARLFIFSMTLALTAGAIVTGFTVVPGFWFFAICLFALAVNGFVFFLSFTYTEFDERHIAKVFRLGRFFRYTYNMARWDEVVTAKTQPDGRNSVVYFQITKRSGQKMTFTVPPKSDAANSFEEIACRFQKGNALEHA